MLTYLRDLGTANATSAHAGCGTPLALTLRVYWSLGRSVLSGGTSGTVGFAEAAYCANHSDTTDRLKLRENQRFEIAMTV
jgi:hypothetical protein